jgi:hypothetical protein
MVGMPGTSAIPAIMPAAIAIAMGWESSCAPMSRPRLEPSSLLATRVVSTAEAVVMISEGICATRPSPIVRIEYFLIATSIAYPFIITTMMSPAIRLIDEMMMPAMASPFTNFMAPSIAPWNCDSFSRMRRRRFASFASINPARRSASMLICLPGIASSVKRAETSDTRSAPFAITMSCSSVMIRKITRPTTRLPLTTKLPNAWMTSPASA